MLENPHRYSITSSANFTLQDVVENKNEYTVSKRYFEKIAIDVVGEFLDKDGLISPLWWK